ncbi:MAG: hypothetical protein LBI42_08825 [Chitinispirillales bacterium]|jgi:hypothetical protein|nr:hypothetical protein [Chitinispirillales bacterium]
MGTCKEHKKQAFHNDEFRKFIVRHDRPAKYNDWYVTTSFYSAVHYIEAMFDVIEPSVTIEGVSETVKHSDQLSNKLFTDVTIKPPRKTAHAIRLQTLKENSELNGKSVFSRIYIGYNRLYREAQDGIYNFMNPELYNLVSIGSRLDTVSKLCSELTTFKGGSCK